MMNELGSAFGMNEVSHLPLLIRGVVVILLGGIGIVVVMAAMPISTEEASTIFASDKFRTSPAKLVGADAQIPLARTEGDARVSVKCPECSVIASMREIEQLDDEIDPGADGGVASGSRNETTGKPVKIYEITVRMRDGSKRVFMDANSANWRVGQRVVFIEGASRSND